MAAKAPSIPSSDSPPAESAAGYGGGITTFVVLCSTVAASGGVLFGFELGISGGVTAMDSFLEKFFPGIFAEMRSEAHVGNYCKFNSQALTAFTSSLYIAGLFATLAASRVTEKQGRRTSMLVGAALFLTGSAVGGAAVNLHMLILGRILLGFGLGFTVQSIPIYLSEMAPPKYRGAISGGFETCISLGNFLANIVNYEARKIKSGWGWRISLSSAALPAIFLLVGTIFLPESPSCLIHRGSNVQAAGLLLQKIRGTAEVDKELDDIVAAKDMAREAALHDNPFSLLTRRRYRPYLVMSIVLPMFLNITGINAVNFYAPVMFRAIGLKESASLLSTVIMRGAGFASTAAAMLVAADRVGRRMLFLTGGAVMTVSLLLLGIVLKTELHDQGAVGSRGAYPVIGFASVFVVAFGWSWGPMVWLVLSEMFPMEIRSAGMSMQVLVNLAMTSLVAQSMLALLCALKAGLFFLFMGGVGVMTLFAYFFLPETKGVALEKMSCVWAGHWYWKRFVMSDQVDHVRDNKEYI